MKKLILKTAALSLTLLFARPQAVSADMLSIDQINKIYGGSAKSGQLKSEFTLRQWIESKGLRDRVIQDSKNAAENFFIRGDNTHNEEIAKYLTFNELRSFVKDQNDHVCKGLGLKEGSVEAALATPELNALKSEVYARLGDEKITDFLAGKNASVPQWGWMKTKALTLISQLYPTTEITIETTKQVYYRRSYPGKQCAYTHGYLDQAYRAVGWSPKDESSTDRDLSARVVYEVLESGPALTVDWLPDSRTFVHSANRETTFHLPYHGGREEGKLVDYQHDFKRVNQADTLRLLNQFRADNLKYVAMSREVHGLTRDERVEALKQLGLTQIQAEAAYIRTFEKNHGEDFLIHNGHSTRFPPLYCKGTMAQVIQHYHGSDDFQVKVSQGDPDACRAYKMTLLQKQTEAICQIRDRVLGEGAASSAAAGGGSVDPACAALMAEVFGHGSQ